jgi:hypothetical protein
MTRLAGVEYINTQSQILLIAGMVAQMPLADFVETAEFSDSFAPFVDPTLYIAGAPRLREIIKIAIALRAFQKTAVEVKAKLEAMG